MLDNLLLFFYLSFAKEKKANQPFRTGKKICHFLCDSRRPGITKTLNWRMKESKVVSDISGLGIWQSAVWRAAKSRARPENAKKSLGECKQTRCCEGGGGILGGQIC